MMYFHQKLKVQYFQRVISGKMDTISRTDGDGEHGTISRIRTDGEHGTWWNKKNNNKKKNV